MTDVSSNILSYPEYVSLLIIAIISFILTFICFTLLLNRTSKNFSFYLMLNLFFCSCLQAIGFSLNYTTSYDNKDQYELLYPINKYNGLCQSQSFIIIFCSFSETLWVLIIIFDYYIAMSRPNDNSLLNNQNENNQEEVNYQKQLNMAKFLLFCLIGYILPLILWYLFYITDSTGVNVKNCSIINEKPIGQLLISIFQCLCFIIIACFTTNLLNTLMNFKRVSMEISIGLIILRVIIFPLIMFFARIIPIILSIIAYFTDSDQKFINGGIFIEIMKTFSLLLIPSQGIFFPIIYMINKNIRNVLYQLYCKCNKKDRHTINETNCSFEEGFTNQSTSLTLFI